MCKARRKRRVGESPIQANLLIVAIEDDDFIVVEVRRVEAIDTA